MTQSEAGNAQKSYGIGDVIPKGEAQGIKTTLITENQSVATRTVRPNETSEQVLARWTFDFSETSRKVLIELATRSLVIDIQGDYRKSPNNDLLEKTYTVPLAKATKGATKSEKASKMMEGLSDKERAEIIAKYSNLAERLESEAIK